MIIPISVPKPMVVAISVSPIQSVGSNITLTCSVELSSAVDVLVIVNTVWTGPNGFMTTNTAQPVMGSTTAYTSTAMVSSFGRDQSGDYNCTATVSSTSSFLTDSGSQSRTARITVGKIDNYVYMYTMNILVEIFIECYVLYFLWECVLCHHSHQTYCTQVSTSP